MDLLLIRETMSSTTTIGSLFIDDVFECFTLEDVVRRVKIPGITAIPAGTYEVVIDVSKRLGRTPRLLNVPNFTGIRIHKGNKEGDTNGCILVGQTRSADFIGKSKLAFDRLMPKLEAGVADGKLTIAIENAFGAPLADAARAPLAKRAGGKKKKKNAASST